MKLSRTQQRILAYLGGVGTVVVGALLEAKSPTASLALITAGGYMLGALREQALPPPHRRKSDPEGVTVPPEKPE